MEHVGRWRPQWIYRMTNGKLSEINSYNFRTNAEKKNSHRFSNVEKSI